MIGIVIILNLYLSSLIAAQCKKQQLPYRYGNDILRVLKNSTLESTHMFSDTSINQYSKTLLILD